VIGETVGVSGEAVATVDGEEPEALEGPGLGALLRPLADREALRAAPRLFLERAWAAGLVGTVALSVVFVLLGQWQFHRYEGKLTRRDRIVANYDALPRPLGLVLASARQVLSPGQEWTPVRVAGQYDADGMRLVRNRPLDGNTGYEVLVPLRLGDGGLLVVDRGWIPAGRTGRAPDQVPPVPAGSVEVVARLRPGEPASGRGAPPGQVQRIDLTGLAGALHGPVYRAYGVLAVESPSPAAAPTLLPRPSVDLGPHLSYAVQWWGFAVTAYSVLGAMAVREVQARRRRVEGGVS